MNAQDTKRLANSLSGTAEMLGKNISDEAIAMMTRMFAGHDVNDVLRALYAHVKASPFWPTPADLIQRMQNGGKSIKEVSATADRAWFNVRHAMQRFGPYQHVKFEDGAIAPAILAIGGWGYCCNANDMREIERRFKEAYDPSVTSDRMLKGQNGFSDEPNLIAITDTPAFHALPDESEKSETVSPIIRSLMK